MYGQHLLRSKSKTQATIALSLGESETLAAIKAGTESLGMMSLMDDFGVKVTSTLRLDASAALGILQRKGVGKIRHLDVGCLWLQEKEAREQIRLAKEPGETNPADLGTKNLTEEVMLRHLAKMSCEYRDGRPASSSKVIATVGPERSSKSVRKEVAKPGVWVQEGLGRWTKKDKGARALRGFQGCIEAGIELKDVIHYNVNDTYDGKVVAAVNVRGRKASDAAFTARLHKPTDIVTELICANVVNRPEKLLCCSSVRRDFMGEDGTYGGRDRSKSIGCQVGCDSSCGSSQFACMSFLAQSAARPFLSDELAQESFVRGACFGRDSFCCLSDFGIESSPRGSKSTRTHIRSMYGHTGRQRDIRWDDILSCTLGGYLSHS